MAMAAGFTDRNLGKPAPEGPVEQVGEAIGLIGRFSQDQTFLAGLKQVNDAINEPSRFGERFIGSFLGGFVPYSAAQRVVQKAIDPEVRSPVGMYQRIRAGLPFGDKDDMKPRITAFGESYERTGATGLQAFAPWVIGPSKTTPMEEEFRRLKWEPPTIQGKFSVGGTEYKLSPDEFEAYAKELGPVVKQALESLVASPGYKMLSDADRKEALKDAARGAAGPYQKAQRMRAIASMNAKSVASAGAL